MLWYETELHECIDTTLLQRIDKADNAVYVSSVFCVGTKMFTFFCFS